MLRSSAASIASPASKVFLDLPPFEFRMIRFAPMVSSVVRSVGQSVDPELRKIFNFPSTKKAIARSLGLRLPEEIIQCQNRFRLLSLAQEVSGRQARQNDVDQLEGR